MYNRTVEYLSKIEGKRPSWMTVCKEVKLTLPEWCNEAPYQSTRMAIREACDNLTRCKVKAKQSGKSSRLSFKSRKEPEQSCFIPSTAVKEKGVYHKISGAGLKYSEKLPSKICDCRLKLSGGRWYLVVPHETQRKETENQGRVVALDPGVRKFITYYSEDSYGEIGSGDFSKIYRQLSKSDRLISRAALEKNRVRRKRLRRAAERIRYRVRNLIDEIHHKTSRYLVDHYDVILLPTFEVQQMTTRSGRRLRSKTVRAMLTWSHFRFKQFLKWKAFENNKEVIDVNEAYTSKTCSWSGEIVNIGGRKVIRGSDGVRMDRDANGARGILLRALVDTPWAGKPCSSGGAGA